MDAIVKARDGDAAIGVVHGRQNVGEHMDRIARGAAEQAGMQVPIGTGEPDLFIDQAAQRRGDRRRLRVPHAGVANQGQVAAQFRSIVPHKAEQMLRAALLLALDHHGDIQRQRAGDRPESAAGLDESHGLAFVVAGAAGDDDLAATIEGLDPRLEWRRPPQVERVDRLHVIMAVEQHPRRVAVGCAVAAFTDDDRVAPGRPHAGLEAEPAQIGRDIFGRGAAVRRIRPGRSISIECATARTGDPDWHQGPGRCGREPGAELRMPSWRHLLIVR